MAATAQILAPSVSSDERAEPPANGVSCEDAQDAWAVASFYLETSKMYGENWFFQLPSGKLTWQWKSTFPNRKYIDSNGGFDICYVSLPECRWFQMYYRLR